MDPVSDPFATTLSSDDRALARSEMTKNGFAIFRTRGLHEWALDDARRHLQQVFQGVYDRGVAPPKPLTKVDPEFSFSAPMCSVPPKRVRTQHIINIWHCDSFFHALATSRTLGKLVAQVCGWEDRGCRLAQDQVWVKPPGAGALSFHRDTTYFDFVPKEVATVWFTFDATDGEVGEDLGPLEYCCGSHLWSLARRGSANQFFDSDYTAMLRDAAQKEIAMHEHAERNPWSVECAKSLNITKVLAAAGGFSIHNGNTWHGSGPNQTSTFRRGIGIHFVPGDAQFNLDDVGHLWRPYVDPEGSSRLLERFFPWTCEPSK